MRCTIHVLREGIVLDIDNESELFFETYEDAEEFGQQVVKAAKEARELRDEHPLTSLGGNA